MPPTAVDSNGAKSEPEDTIVVKGRDNRLAHQSSLESSPEVEPLVVNDLATINGPQKHLMHLESPEPDDLDEHDDQKRSPSRGASMQEGSMSSPKPRQQLLGTSEERLLQLPELRPLPWREGVNPASENEVGGESRRKQIRFGCLLATRGEIQKIPCTTCANGRGKFSVCVALDEFFKGACASCQLSGGPNRCSRKKQEDDDDDKSATRRMSEKPRKSSANTLKRLSADRASQAKRRRTGDNVEGTSTGEHKPQWRQEPRQTQAHILVQDPWQALNQQPANTRPQQPKPLQPAPQQPTPQHSPPNPPPLNSTINHQSSQQYTPDRRTSAGWAQLAPLQGPPPNSHPILQPQRGPLPPSQLPPPQLQHPKLPPPQTMLYHPSQPPRQESTTSRGLASAQHLDPRRDDRIGHEDGVALIDTLPKSKQRQLYALVSGIQGGLKRLQSELDLLKNTLGMEDQY